MSQTLLNDVRVAVMSAFQAAHTTTYPLIKVDYPNVSVVDIEHQTDPFVRLHLDLSGIERAAMGDLELLVPGMLSVYFYYKEGTGTLASTQYTDMLNARLGLHQIGHLFFHVVKPIEIKTFPGWVGTMNYIKFDVSRSVTGS